MFRIPLNKINESRSIDFNALPDVSKQHVIEYGLKQLLNDAMANGIDNAVRRALADKRLDNLMAGVIRASRESDPVSQEARKLAIKRARAEWEANGTKVTADIHKSEAFRARVDELRVHPVIVKKAEEMVAMASDLEALDID